MLTNKTVVLVGGTGSFGRAALQRLLRSDVGEVRILSRDEKKQHDLRLMVSDQRVKFYLGDVRDLDSLTDSLSGANFVFHAAALKQVPSCEFFPVEAVKTNILGTNNVLTASQRAGVAKVVCLSTDKAVYPINAMGISKAMMEKVVAAKSREYSISGMDVCTTRYGNVMASRGSVIPLFLKKIASGLPLTVTDRSMTRFMMSLDEAVELVMYAFRSGQNGDLLVQKSPAASIDTLVNAIIKFSNIDTYPVKIIGTRHGEKLYETLLSREEMSVAEDAGKYYRVPIDNRDLNYDVFFDDGDSALSQFSEYNSHNTDQLTVNEMVDLLKTIKLDSYD